MITYTKEIKISNKLTCGYQTFCDINHPLAVGAGWVYFHRHIASLKIGRWLEKGEVVHHIDGNRVNNDLDNLIVISQSDHAKIHYPNNHKFHEKNEERYSKSHERTKSFKRTKAYIIEGEVRKGRKKHCTFKLCAQCGKEMSLIGFDEQKKKFCSKQCHDLSRPKIQWPEPEILQKMLWEESTVKIAEKLGVSDVAVAKYCKKHKLTKPNRGYWAKIGA